MTDAHNKQHTLDTLERLKDKARKADKTPSNVPHRLGRAEEFLDQRIKYMEDDPRHFTDRVRFTFWDAFNPDGTGRSAEAWKKITSVLFVVLIGLFGVYWTASINGWLSAFWILVYLLGVHGLMEEADSDE